MNNFGYIVGFSLHSDVAEDDFAYETDVLTYDLEEALENAADLHDSLRLGYFSGYVFFARLGGADNGFITVHTNREFDLNFHSWDEEGDNFNA